MVLKVFKWLRIPIFLILPVLRCSKAVLIETDARSFSPRPFPWSLVVPNLSREDNLQVSPTTSDLKSRRWHIRAQGFSDESSCSPFVVPFVGSMEEWGRPAVTRVNIMLVYNNYYPIVLTCLCLCRLFVMFSGDSCSVVLPGTNPCALIVLSRVELCRILNPVLC